jgi:hypothetical protein
MNELLITSRSAIIGFRRNFGSTSESSLRRRDKIDMSDFVTYMKNIFLMVVLVFVFLGVNNLATYPETLGRWLAKVDAARYEGLPIDVN